MLRQLRRNRGFHAAVILLLGLGIGAATLVFSLVNELLLKPLPVRNPRNLYLLEHMSPRQVRPDPSFSERALNEVVRKNPLVSAVAAEQAIAPQYLVPFREGDTTRLLMPQIVSPNYFAELGVRALLGRVLDESDAKPAATLPAVISYHWWQSQFGGDRSILGRTIRLKNLPFVIVGVLPQSFHSADIDRAPDVRLPIAAERPLFGSLPQGVGYEVLIRLAPGVAPERAGASLLPELRRIEEEAALERNARSKDPETPASIHEWAQNWTAYLLPIERGVSRVREQFANALWVLLAGVGILLLAVCANVAGLLIAKSGERRKEIGIRLAIGAGRAAIVRQILAENLALAAMGAILGAAMAWLLAPRLVALLPPVRDLAQYATPPLLAVTPDIRVLAFAAAITIFSALASGLVPAWRASRLDVLSELKSTRGHARLKAAGLAPIALQAAFCTVLLSAAGLMLRSFWKLDHLDAGFDRAHVIEFTIDPASAGYNMQESGAVFRELRARVQTLPGVRSAAWAWRAVMRGAGIKTTVSAHGVVLPAKTFLNASLNEVTPGYFETMGLPLLAGRDLRLSDAGAQPTRVVVNQAFADLFFPRQDPIGKLLAQGADGTSPPNRVIVGLVPTAKYRSMREPDPPTMYGLFNESNGSDWQLNLYVRTYGAPTAIAGAVRKALHNLDAGVPLTETLTLESEIAASLWQERLVAILSAFFGIASVALAAIGLYGALALSVTQRRRELGIRVAIGAQLRDVIRTVCSPVAVALGCGAGAGLVASVWLLHLTRALLYGVEPVDGASLAAAIAVLALCSGAAAVIPARRAARVDPATALREE